MEAKTKVRLDNRSEGLVLGIRENKTSMETGPSTSTKTLPKLGNPNEGLGGYPLAND